MPIDRSVLDRPRSGPMAFRGMPAPMATPSFAALPAGETCVRLREEVQAGG